MTAAGLHAQPAPRFLLASATGADGQPIVGLSAEDFVISAGADLAEPLNATPAAYPVALVVDTSESARADFVTMRSAARQFLDRLQGREVALYTFGERAMKVTDFTRDTAALTRAVDRLFARPGAESHVLDALIEAAKDITKRESAVTLIAVISAGGNDQSSRTPGEVFSAVLGSRSIVQVIEMRTPRASGRLSNVRGRRSSTGDRAAEASLALEELLRGIASRSQGGYRLIYSASGFQSGLEELQRGLASEVVVEYVPANDAGANAPLKLGIRLQGAVVRGVGLASAPR